LLTSDLSSSISAVTPIAAELHQHFASGGSIVDGVRLVALLERVTGKRAASNRQAFDRQRGSRLPPDWQPSMADVAFAIDRRMSRGRLENEIEKFRNYWTAKGGAGATKRDWSATWRNWIITARERGHGPSNSGGRGPGTIDASRRPATGSDAILAGMGRLADQVDQRRMSALSQGREVSHDTGAAGQFDFGAREAR
jgi:hypothetical protein